MMHSHQSAHLEPGDIARATTVRGSLYNFEVVSIGDFDIITCRKSTPDDLDNIAAAFRDAAQLMRERILSEAAEPPTDEQKASAAE